MVASSGQQIADGTGPTFTFTPGNAGTYTVTFTVIDPNVGWDSADVVITSLDVPPVLTAPTASQSAFAGVSTSINLGTLAITGIGPFTDTVQWGDGQSSTFDPRAPALSLAHTYAKAGTYTIGETVSEYDGGSYRPSFLVDVVSVDLTPPTSHVVNSLGTSQTSDSFPVSVTFSDPAGSGGAPASGVSSVDLYVSVNNGPFSLYQTMNFAPTASGTVTFTFAGQDRNIYAFHSIAHDAAGNTESKNSNTIEASTSVPDLQPARDARPGEQSVVLLGPVPVVRLQRADPVVVHRNGVFTLNWAGADPDQNSGTPAGSIALVDIYVEVDGGTPTLDRSAQWGHAQ